MDAVGSNKRKLGAQVEDLRAPSSSYVYYFFAVAEWWTARHPVTDKVKRPCDPVRDEGICSSPHVNGWVLLFGR